MQKVISINLNGHAYQLEESGYEVLRAYLAGADRDLASNPDRVEIMADLEQAIADRCAAVIGPHKSVVTASEVDRIVAEMGPVDAAPDGGESRAGTSGSAGSARTDPSAKRLYRITDGAMIAGVCNGVAAYFQMDVTLVRIGFVLTALTTKGVGVMAYVIMMFAVPEASTPDERAAASGGPFNAKDVVDRAAKHASEGARHMRKTWLHQESRWRRHTRPFAHSAVRAPVPSAVNGALAAIFTGVHFVVFFALVAAIVSLVNHEAVLGWNLDPDVPVWAAVLILLVLYQIAITPLRAAAGAPWAASGGWGNFWSATVWLIGLAFALWIGSEHLPELREFAHRVPDLLRDFRDAMRELLSKG
ncbi:MAG: PspC domain-containing protein [Acidobacteriota bacterium]|nr:PspC domain-containing protein [Acidobacteriota bacterium]